MNEPKQSHLHLSPSQFIWSVWAYLLCALTQPSSHWSAEHCHRDSEAWPNLVLPSGVVWNYNNLQREKQFLMAAVDKWNRSHCEDSQCERCEGSWSVKALRVDSEREWESAIQGNSLRHISWLISQAVCCGSQLITRHVQTCKLLFKAGVASSYFHMIKVCVFVN